MSFEAGSSALGDHPGSPSPDGGGPDSDARVGDPLGMVAIMLGCLGIVLGGVVLAIVTAVVAAIAGSRARAAGRSLENAYIAFALAGVDGVVWLVLHMIFDLNFLAG